jgi:hypothetical protein
MHVPIIKRERKAGSTLKTTLAKKKKKTNIYISTKNDNVQHKTQETGCLAQPETKVVNCSVHEHDCLVSICMFF